MRRQGAVQVAHHQEPAGTLTYSSNAARPMRSSARWLVVCDNQTGAQVRESISTVFGEWPVRRVWRLATVAVHA